MLENAICIRNNASSLICTYDVQGRTVLKGEYVYIRQSMSACILTNICYSLHSKNMPKPDSDCLVTLYSKE